VEDATQFVDAIATLVDLVDDPVQIRAETRDQDDDSLVALARGHNVDVIVSGERPAWTGRRRIRPYSHQLSSNVVCEVRRRESGGGQRSRSAGPG
jgi:hypothetical protein